MKMKYTVISLLIAFIVKISTVNALETDNKQQETFSSVYGKYLEVKKYSTITYDIYAGVKIGHFSHESANDGYGYFHDMVRMSKFQFSAFAGIDFYLGGYYDEYYKIKRERLISPLIGVQIDKNFGSLKATLGTSYKEDFNILFKLGVVFKLKYDVNMKSYVLVGLSKNKINGVDIVVSSEDYITKSVKTETERSISPLAGAGLEFVIKQRFLVGTDIYVNTLKEIKGQVSLYRPDGHGGTILENTSSVGSGERHTFNISAKFGFVF